MLCKDRVFKSFRSLYTQWPAQSSVLCRSFVFNAEVAKYACISRMASRDHKLAQKGIVELIPGAPLPSPAPIFPRYVEVEDGEAPTVLT